MNNATCAKCGSDRIIPRAKVVDRGHTNSRRDLEIEVNADPGALIFKEAYASPVHARVCAGCGHIEFYADDKESLWDAYQQSLKRR